jgi:uncharacterized protein YbaR (Trm112 family)
MALPEELLEKLVCPQCHGKLTYVAEANQLECPNCRLSYKVIDDIPVLEIDKAEKME